MKLDLVHAGGSAHLTGACFKRQPVSLTSACPLYALDATEETIKDNNNTAIIDHCPAAFRTISALSLETVQSDTPWRA